MLLARAGESGMSRDKILGYLWPDSEPEKARGGLAQALYALKRDLGSDELFVGTRDLRLNSGRDAGSPPGCRDAEHDRAPDDFRRALSLCWCETTYSVPRRIRSIR
ncbi:MAG TPA: hypothetical protein VFU40_00245 [Gemmatimonadales bacterium]|nr:hypothetical protein [Gemmatimonadales bacterium]